MKGKHLIGRCRKCGRTKDYTTLQARDPGFNQIFLDRLTRPDVNFERILSDRTKGGKREPKKVRLSRGRVG